MRTSEAVTTRGRDHIGVTDSRSWARTASPDYGADYAWPDHREVGGTTKVVPSTRRGATARHTRIAVRTAHTIAPRTTSTIPSHSPPRCQGSELSVCSRFFYITNSALKIKSSLFLLNSFLDKHIYHTPWFYFKEPRLNRHR